MTAQRVADLRVRIAETEQAFDAERDLARAAALRGDRHQALRHDTAADLLGEHLDVFEDQLATALRHGGER